MTNRIDNARRAKAPAGEAYVWLSSLGLSFGLLMIGAILLVIVYQGLRAFWPREVAKIVVKEDRDDRINGSRIIAGEIVKKQRRKGSMRSTASGDDQEWQLFVGNKDTYGFSFYFLDVEAIDSIDYPPNIMTIEREEYGRALVVPQALYLAGRDPVAATSDQFDDEFRALLKEINDRRDEIRRIEKVEIGRINKMMERIRLRSRVLAKEHRDSPDSAEVTKLSRQQHDLQTEYEFLAKQARTLRNKQFEHELEVALISGEKRRYKLGSLIDYYYPNRLSLTDKLGIFGHMITKFISESPREANTEGGIFPAIFGTFVMTIIMSLLVAPLGVVAAIYLTEYAKQGFFVKMVRIAVNNLAGIPSIVFGVFGLGFFVYFVGGTIDQLFFADALPTPTFGTGGILWASLTLALLTVPVVIVATEEGLSAVPRGMREGGFACGASKWQCIQRIVLPTAAPGILTGVILAMARGAGEVAPLRLVGVVKLAPTLPVNMTYPFFHLEQKFMHLGFHIYDLGFQSPDSEAAIPMVFATALLLIMLVVLLNLAAITVRERLRHKYAVSAV